MAYEKADDVVLASLKDADFLGTPVNLDLTQDAWEFSAPPPAGIYDIKLFLAKDGLVISQYDKKDPLSKFFKVNIEARIKSDDPDLDNLPVFDRVTSRIPKRKAISTMAGLIVKLGYGDKLPKPCSDKDLTNYMLAILKKEPVVKVELDWKASYKWTNKKQEDEWVNVYNHYTEFPQQFREVARFSITGKDGTPVEIRPQLFIAKWFGKGETPTMTTHATSVQAPIFAPSVQVAEEPIFAPVVQQTAPVQQQLVSQPRGPVANAPTEDELNLMLE